MKKLVLFLALTMTSNSYATLLEITCTGSVANCNTLAPVIATMKADLNADLPDADQSSYLAGMADAAAASQKGIGTDYINDIDVFVVGLGVGVGAHVGNNTLSDLLGGDIDGEQLRGIGLSPSLMLGINMGMFDLPEWEYFDPNKVKLMVNFFTFSKDDTDFNAKFTNFGIHGRYRIVEEKAILPAKLLHWHGVNVSTGFEYTSLELAYTNTETTTYTDGGITANIAGTVKAGAKVTTMSIPVEASTAVTLGYIFTLYGGAGLDVSFGSAESIANVNAPITLGGTAPGGTSLTANLDLGQKDGPTTFLPRAFVGLGLGVPLVKLNFQLNKGFGEEVYGLTAALRVTW
ncbi:MAG: hypothetical protein KC493_01290 [Bacteriovoracaceae bacterium]|nr:hypothetical protein [Bacteriovoracaceae bacterium]